MVMRTILKKAGKSRARNEPETSEYIQNEMLSGNKSAIFNL
jgi:hypothetical protein